MSFDVEDLSNWACFVGFVNELRCKYIVYGSDYVKFCPFVGITRFPRDHSWDEIFMLYPFMSCCHV